ncbi:MAG TPA: XrtA/PEP-CTERM system TPR-repeat protein PrsT [Noviherbaspirillum sp.]|nr:XrtA/PEP-CTERM system TPR-repeat protein PrsT [Noviherbaspirillum sp.]
MATLYHTRHLCIAMISGTLLTSGLTACGKTQSVQALVAEAGEYHRKGDNKAAIIQLKNALQKNPDDRDARLLLGTIYIDTNDPQSAEKEVRKAIELGVHTDQTLVVLAKALLMQGKFEKVLEETAPKAGTAIGAEIAAVRGNAYLSLGKTQEAKESFELARKDNADNPDALIGLAKQAYLLKDVDTANRYSEQAVSKNPASAEAWNFKGDLQRAQAKAEPALAAYEEALKLKPDYAAALVAKATIEIGAGRYDAARASLETARKNGASTVGVLYAQALLDYKQGKLPAALESLQHVLRTAPGYLQAQLLAGTVQYELGATQQAEMHLKAYLEKRPDDLHARKLLAATLLRNGEAKRALTIVSAAAKEAPQDTQLLTLAGESSAQAKDFSGAAEYFQKASAIAPQDAMIRTALGKVKLGQGDSSGAIDELQKAVALEKQPGQADKALILAYLQQKQYDKALAMVNAIEKEQPKNPELQHLKGGIYLAKKDVQSARQSYERALSYDPTYFNAVASLARLDMIDKKPDAAKKRFEVLLAADKKNVQAMIALGSIALAQQQNDEATRWFERAHGENPDAMAPASQLAAHYLRIGQNQKALSLAQKLQASNPSNADALELLAKVQFASNDKSAALDSYEKLAALNPSSAGAYVKIAAIHMAMQKPAEAGDALKKALSLQPDYLEAQVALASVEQARGRREQALSLARGIQKQHEKSPVGYVLEAELLLAQQKLEPAITAYERAYALGKTATLAMKLHTVLRQAGREKEADKYVEQWLKDHPGDTKVHASLAQSFLAAGQNKQAIKYYEAVLQQAPTDILALNNLAWLYQQENDKRALQYGEKAYAADSNNPSVLDTLGWILVERGEHARGVSLLQRAVTLAPDATEIRYRLALGLVKSGDKEKARSELQRLLEPGKEFSKAKEARALLTQL